jgi:hypothetical protein
MKFLTIYKILTYILFPFAALFALNAINSLFVSLTNPALLVVTFTVACMPIYVYTSSKFLFSGILKAKPSSAKLKDWIKVNAVVSVVFAAFIFLGGLGALLMLQNPEAFTQALQQMPAEQKNIMGAMNPQQMEQFLKIGAAILLPLSFIIIIHVILTFRFLKIYHYVFDKA